MFIYHLLAYFVLNSSQIFNLKWELKYILDPGSVLLLEDEHAYSAHVSFTCPSRGETNDGRDITQLGIHSVAAFMLLT
jgi:hypothetical protein